VPAEGVTCLGEHCLSTLTDALSDEYLLLDPRAPGAAIGTTCAPSVVARGAALVGNGDQLALLGRLPRPDHARVGKDEYLVSLVGVAELEAPPASGCLQLTVTADSAEVDAFQLRGSATTVAPDGNLVTFLGFGRTHRVIRLVDRRLQTEPVADPGQDSQLGDDDPSISRALRSSDGGTLVVRPKFVSPTLSRPFGLEWIAPGERGVHRLWPNQSSPSYDVEQLLEGSPTRLRAFESDGKIVLLGEKGVPVPFSRNGELTLEPAGPSRGGSRGAAMVSLPWWQSDRGYRPGSILVAGGSPEDAAGGARFDVYDPGVNGWQQSVARSPWPLHYAVPVLLPTGEIAFIGGRPEEKRVVYVDAKNGFTVAEGGTPMGHTRGAGTTALLLPSGAVFVTGGYYTAEYRPQENDKEEPGVQILRPPYLASGRGRPVIAGLPPAQIRVGEPFSLQVEPARSPVAEVVLMAFGTAAAGQNTAQRLVELAISDRGQDGRRLTVMGPVSLDMAPPGRYLLFVVDGDRLPSVAVAVSVPS
jgi:hypothetical protein